jgi:hypothetical protein
VFTRGRPHLGRDDERHGVEAVTIQKNKIILSAIFTTALNDQVTFIHPCRGVKTPPVAAKSRTIITPEQFDLLYKELPDADTHTMAGAARRSRSSV